MRSAAVVVWSNRSLLEQCTMKSGVILSGDRCIWDSVIIEMRYVFRQSDIQACSNGRSMRSCKTEKCL